MKTLLGAMATIRDLKTQSTLLSKQLSSTTKGPFYNIR